MSFASPYIPPSLEDAELAADMRRLAERLDAQARKFDRENEHAKLALFMSAARQFRETARDLRINADKVQPE